MLGVAGQGGAVPGGRQRGFTQADAQVPQVGSYIRVIGPLPRFVIELGHPRDEPFQFGGPLEVSPCRFLAAQQSEGHPTLVEPGRPEGIDLEGPVEVR